MSVCFVVNKGARRQEALPFPESMEMPERLDDDVEEAMKSSRSIVLCVRKDENISEKRNPKRHHHCQ